MMTATSPRLTVSYIAFILHRLSGLGLALFLPFHFLVLGLAIEGEAELDAMLIWTEQPLVKFAEWGLVVMFALHLMLGLRVLVIEWAPWTSTSKLRHGWIAAAGIIALTAGGVFLLGINS